MKETKKRWSMVVEPSKIDRLKVMSDKLSTETNKLTVSEIVRKGIDTMLADFEEGRLD